MEQSGSEVRSDGSSVRSAAPRAEHTALPGGGGGVRGVGTPQRWENVGVVMISFQYFVITPEGRPQDLPSSFLR